LKQALNMGSSRLEGHVGIKPSPELLSQLQLAFNQEGAVTPPASISKVLEGQTKVLPVEALQWLAKNFSNLPGLAEALLSSQLLLPERVAAPRNPELEERCVKLRKEQEEREYRQMTGNVRRDNEKVKGEEPLKKQLEEVNGFLMLIVQFVVSVVCAFMAGYMGPYLLYGRTDMGSRLLIGIVFGFIVGCADMYFVIRQLLEEDGIKLKKIE